LRCKCIIKLKKKKQSGKQLFNVLPKSCYFVVLLTFRRIMQFLECTETANIKMALLLT
jgi:hypothetical protein